MDQGCREFCLFWILSSTPLRLVQREKGGKEKEGMGGKTHPGCPQTPPWGRHQHDSDGGGPRMSPGDVTWRCHLGMSQLLEDTARVLWGPPGGVLKMLQFHHPQRFWEPPAGTAGISCGSCECPKTSAATGSPRSHRSQGCPRAAPRSSGCSQCLQRVLEKTFFFFFFLKPWAR